MSNYHHIHCIGIGGIGLSGLALLYRKIGVTVTGSDTTPSDITRGLQDHGITVAMSHVARNVSHDTDMVIRSVAVGDDNPEVVEAVRLHIPVVSYPEALAHFIASYRTRIIVSGTNGKSTTTAMLATLLHVAGQDPTALVGSLVPAWNMQNILLGTSDIAVVEGCEWRGHMNKQEPTMIVLTNLELEHTDYYKDMHHLIEEFSTFVHKLPPKGIVIINDDRAELRDITIPSSVRVVRYGSGKNADIRYEKISVHHGAQQFRVQCYDTGSIDVTLKVPGVYNVENAVAAVAAAYAYNVPFDLIEKGINAYTGIWRRFEIKGMLNGATIISDYAHHPDALQKVLAGARQFYPDKKIIALFQPHHHRRTKDLFNEFAHSFADATEVIVTDIYDVEGREDMQDQDVHARDLAIAIAANGVSSRYVADVSDLRIMLQKTITQDDVLLIMGAGDINLFANKLTSYV